MQPAIAAATSYLICIALESSYWKIVDFVEQRVTKTTVFFAVKVERGNMSVELPRKLTQWKSIRTRPARSAVIKLIGRQHDTLLSGKALRLTEPATEEVKTWTKARARALRLTTKRFSAINKEITLAILHTFNH